MADTQSWGQNQNGQKSLSDFIAQNLLWDVRGYAAQQMIQRYGNLPSPYTSLLQTPTSVLAELLRISQQEAGWIQNEIRNYTGSGTVQVALSATVVQQPQAVSAPSKWAHLQNAMGKSSTGLGADFSSALIYPWAVNAAADLALAYVLLKTDFRQVLGARLFKGRRMTNEVIRQEIDEIDTALLEYKVIFGSVLQELFETAQQIFGASFDELVTLIARLYDVKTTNTVIGSAARIDVTRDVGSFNMINSLLPKMAQEISETMVSSPAPERVKRFTGIIQRIVELLKKPSLHRILGIEDNLNPEAAAKVAIRMLVPDEPKIADLWELALAYESYVHGLAECPGTIKPGEDDEYVNIMAAAAANIVTKYVMLTGSTKGVVAAETASSFQHSGKDTRQARQFSIGFTIGLKATW